ncbi:ABC transporter permease [Sneathia sanguinegens]|uniref:ABC transporter permease n=1 Tax=Sneathia sanguinegens TaxID=40543 RepID=UPI002909F1C8|nr:ABC transporter permease [Sneathia sanguinegens]MDU7496565.1 ABC transporter permease [Sneathia sanguinegens]
MKKLKDYSLVILLLIVWEILSDLHIISEFLLPSPYQVILAFVGDFGLLMRHTYYTLLVAFIGVFIGIILSFILSLSMDLYQGLYDLVYPVIILTQTIPTIAIAPLLIIWLGYYMKPKIVLVVISTFFPITISLLNGYKAVDKDNIQLLKAMGANTFQMYRYLKIPSAMSYFFSGLKVSMSYSLISAVISEWLGGYYGLGVYMTRVKKAFALDKMFAVIFLITFLSLLLMSIIDILEKKIIKK